MRVLARCRFGGCSSCEPPSHSRYRFVLGSTNGMKTKLDAQSTDLDSDVSDLKKKLHYLETTAKNSREHIDQIIRSGGRA